MDEEETKVCPNCKREIPGINFTTHTVHCARNLRVCRVCKEPVPVADLQKHHDELHKQLPCKQCGESVCGTDLEDHIRDSCANTVKSCRFCSLELPRRELPAHEGYCGVRTEQCADCREWVMIKYRQLHLDSNHGFIRLHDDPAPIPKKDPYKSNLNRPTAPKNVPSTSNGFVPSSIFENFTKSKVERTDRLGNNNDGSSSSGGSSLSESVGRSGGSGGSGGSDSGGSSSSGLGRKTQNTNGAQPPLKRTNDQPQININSAAASKVDKDLGVSRGAVKKRVAPKPPSREPAPAPAPLRDLPYYSALERKQREEKQRAEQNAYNLSVGLPPVLSPAAKVEKLRKMDALQNREVSDNDYKNRLRRDIWSDPSWNTGHMVGRGPSADPGPSNPRPNNDRQNPRPNVLPDAAGPSNLRSNGEPRNNPRPNLYGPLDSGPSAPVNNPRPKLNINGPVKNQSPNDVDMKLEELRNLKPMTPMEFMERFNELQLRPQGGERVERGDRFSEIKSSLRELRRGLNEVTAPYNSNAAANNINNGRQGQRSGSASPASEDAEVRLPCEFCNVPIPMDHLVQHQTGCRPDLAQFRVGAGVAAQAAGAGAGAAAVDNARYRASLNHNPAEHAEDPVIPCEFCARSLPVYLISEHQERCGRESNLLFAD